MIKYIKYKEIANRLGIKVNNMTIYKAELINLRNDGLNLKEIAEILDAKEDNVGRWLSREAQPKPEIIVKLEKLYFMREAKTIATLRNPKTKE